MTIEHIETAIIGAGQAGLATAYHLQRRGRRYLILDSNAKVGDNWRTHWDSLRLYSPAGRMACQGCPSRGPMVLPDQGSGRRLPGGVRGAVRTSGQAVDSCEPPGGGERTLSAPSGR
jgi:cation diffusion facilitator CzcD-associated flavoprotein CzcO